MALNFPNSPGIGSVYTDTTSGFSYEWDGTVWKSYSAASSSQIKILDDISGSFTGIAKTFAITTGSVAITPANAQQLVINLGGVIQDPSDDYSVSGSNLIFSDAPASGLSFSGISLGPAVPQSTIIDGTLTDGSFGVVGLLTAARLLVTGISTFAGISTFQSSVFGTNLSLSGVATASSFVGNVTGNATGLSGSPSITVTGINASGVSTFSGIATHTTSLFGTQASFTGVVTASSFTGTASTATAAGTAYGLTGSPNITVGSITSGNINSSGIVTATSAVVGSAVTVNSSGVNVTGVVTATSFTGNGANLTGLNIPAGYTELDSMLFG